MVAPIREVMRKEKYMLILLCPTHILFLSVPQSKLFPTKNDTEAGIRSADTERKIKNPSSNTVISSYIILFLNPISGMNTPKTNEKTEMIKKVLSLNRLCKSALISLLIHFLPLC